MLRRSLLAATIAAPALAQARPTTIVVPFAPGGSTDILSRMLAERMTALLGAPVLVENRPGGNTIVGGEYVARAQPDGHTILMSAGTTLTINPVVVKNLPYKVEDFAPISLCTTFPFSIIVQNSGPKDIPEFVAAAKARPGRMTYGTNGPTTLTNVAALLVCQGLGITMQDVTYRGDSAQLNDFLAGNLDVLLVAGSTAVPVHRNGQGRLIGWTSAQRVPATPDIPGIGEFAPGVDALSWFGLLAPARTPDATVRRLHQAAAEAVKDARISTRLTADAQFVIGNSPEEFAQFLRDQDRLWRPILTKLDVQNN